MKDTKQIKRIIYTVLRVAIGWHFLYEGISKLFISGWSAEGYLLNSTGPFSGFYQALATSPSLLNIVDILNVYGLILIGVGLFIGLWARYASVAGIALLTLYYFAYPPLWNRLIRKFLRTPFYSESAVYRSRCFALSAFLENKGIWHRKLTRVRKNRVKMKRKYQLISKLGEFKT